MKRLGEICGSCCGHGGPSDLELEKLSSLLARDRDARDQSEKNVSRLRADIKALLKKSEVDATQDTTLCRELQEQVSESAPRIQELLGEEERLRARAGAELQRESAKARSECQGQFEALEQRLADQLRQEKARVLELQSNAKDGKALEARVGELEEANKRLQADLKVAVVLELDAKAPLQALEEKVSSLTVQRGTLTKQAAQLEGNASVTPSLQASTAELQARIEELQGQVLDTDKLQNDLAVQKEACIATEAMMQRLQSEEQVFSEQATTWQSEAVKFCFELESVERQAGEFDVSEEKLQTRLKGAQEQVTGLEQLLDGTNGEIAKLTREVAEEEDANARVSLLAATNKEVRATQSVIQQQEVQLRTLRGEIDAHQARQAKLAEQAELRKQAQLAKQRRFEEERARQERIESRQAKLKAGSAARRFEEERARQERIDSRQQLINKVKAESATKVLAKAKTSTSSAQPVKARSAAAHLASVSDSWASPDKARGPPAPKAESRSRGTPTGTNRQRIVEDAVNTPVPDSDSSASPDKKMGVFDRLTEPRTRTPRGGRAALRAEGLDRPGFDE